ncbi:tetratricopeptide repeat protein [Pelomonas sp. APW6]|uniref:Tetratricopeptide repeat protein n=1 Tax=Roseateles subflavus TaxID=3053353 RepID=A0ABT7LJK6_9BURK|nr:tetratricopeptide repeat protein [Pelomonas sp. APW6]MDL5031721.1 tetratricopeptide repeat protein [Pelomonas sp. APW6]
MTQTAPSSFLAPLTAACLSLVSGALHAQVLDEAELRPSGNDAVLVLRFVTPVQFIRNVAGRSGDLGQVYYDILPTRDTLNLIVAERRLLDRQGAPLVIVTDEAAGTLERSRKLVLRFNQGVAYLVRPGANARSLELVLKDQGSRLLVPGMATAPERTIAPTGPSLVLQTLAPNEEARPIPAALQNYNVQIRPMPGRTEREVVVTGLRDVAEGEALRQAVLARFPGARVDPGQVLHGAGNVSMPPATPAASAARSTREPTALPAAAAGESLPASVATLSQARQLMEQGEHTQAIAKLEDLLALPPHAQTAEAQELIAQARWRQGDPERARAEFELYLKLYPQGPGALRAREALLTLAPPPMEAVQASATSDKGVTTTLSGSLSTFYYGGQSKIRTQDFQDSPLSGLPELVNDATLSGTDQRQIISSVDIIWRRRDADSDLRIVLRDTYTSDQLRSDRSKNKLSALYADYKLLSQGLQFKVGRQSPSGGGVMGRFDGLQVGYRLAPKWRVNAVAGRPTDPLLDAKRSFWGGSIEADDLGKGVGGSVYAIEQRVDGQLDRRGLGTELRVLAGPVTAMSTLDYDPTYRRLNIASVQATWQGADNTVVNALYDRRATPMLMLGNSLFFQNPVLQVQARTLYELMQTQSLDLLRQQVRDTTAFSTQGMLSVTHPLNANWQLGADIRLTNVGALPPVADILPNGQPGTGNVWSLGSQLIGTNLYSARDTHVLLLTLLKGPTYSGQLLSYNNSSAIGESWLLEPSIRFYAQQDDGGNRTQRWAPGLRASKRATGKLVVEGELSMEFSKSDGPSRHESSNRSFYYLGLRYDL